MSTKARRLRRLANLFVRPGSTALPTGLRSVPLVR